MIDLVLLAVVAASALLGAVRGLVGVIASLLAWFGAGWFAFRYGAEMAFLFSSDGQPGATELLGAYAVSFIAVLLLVSLVGWVVRKLVHSVGLSGVDRALGLILGLVRGVLVACMLVLLMAFSSLPQDPAWSRSRAVPALVPAAQWIARWLPDWAVEELDFGNGRSSGDNSPVEQAFLDGAGAVVETVTGALPVPVDESNGSRPGAEPPPPSTPGQ